MTVQAHFNTVCSAAFLAVFFAAPPVTAQQPAPSKSSLSVSTCRPSAEEVQAAATKLSAESVDGNALIQALDHVAGVDTGRFLFDGSISLFDSNGLLISVAPPYGAYRMSVIEAVRKRETLTGLSFSKDVRVLVSVSTISAPDIITLVVERDGREVRATASTLRPVVKATALGAKTLVHEGFVSFPCPAFTPGGEVKVTAISESNGNFVRSLTQSELQWLTGIQRRASMARTSADLVGLPSDEVRGFLGEPTEIDGAIWVYKKKGEIWFRLEEENGRIVRARPADTSIAKYKEP